MFTILTADLISISSKLIGRILFELSSVEKKEVIDWVFYKSNPPKDFKWIEENIEFKIGEDLFDVVSISCSGNIIKISAVSDTKEDLLNKAISGNMKESKKASAKRNAYLFSKYFQNIKEDFIPNSSKIYYHSISIKCTSVNLTLFSPPPESLS